MKRFLVIFIALCAIVAAQTTQTVAISAGNPNASFTALYFYSGSNLQYICKSPSHPVPAYSWSVTPQAGLGTLTSIAVSANVGTVTMTTNHGLQPLNIVTVTGSTVPALNGTYVVQTVPTGTTLTITTVGVSNATYNNAPLTVASTAPRSNAPMWAIQYFAYSGANLIASQWATTVAANQAGTPAYTFACDSRASLAYQ